VAPEMFRDYLREVGNGQFRIVAPPRM
jgi:hypothetical protein